MIETKATRILNLLSIIGSRGIDTKLPDDLQNPIVNKYLELYTSVYATANKSEIKLTLSDEEKAHGDQLRLATSAKFLFSDEMKDAIASLQFELIENELLNVLKEKYKKPTVVSKHATKRIKYISRDFKGTTQKSSLANLHAILDLKLAKKITENMGDGASKSILNYRSGRFANTVQVKNILMRRNGAIEIFYAYMKYPYQTFEPGYKQGSINSRDPRKLISKSIMDIAASLVGNNLRITVI